MITNKDIAKIALNLIVVYVIGGVLLAGMYVYTSPIKEQNEKKAKQAALKLIMPEAGSIEKAGVWTTHDREAEYYVAKNSSGLCGYVIESYGKGYSSFIHVLIATDSAYTVKKLTILAHGETPGLGDEIETSWFQKQFAGKKEAAMKVIKGPTAENIQAISGATISSRAVTEDAVKSALKFLTQAKQGEVPNGH
jgi:Na+-translocating ferredoxin:NAD+ oxidoreductase subunit G